MNLLELQSDPAAFRAALLIDTDQGPRPFAEAMDPWQRVDFEALDDGWKRAVIGTSQPAKYQRGWLEQPRGHGKTLTLGVMCAWALFASRRRISGIAAAADKDQARLLRDAIGKLVYCNPWLDKFLTVGTNYVTNEHTQSALDVISSDAPSAMGLTPDFLAIDELVHWRKRDLWDALFSSAAKRSTSMVQVITNAGITGDNDWAWQTRESVRNDPAWYFARLDGPVASWISPAMLAEQERLLPATAYQRLWLNQWTSGYSDVFSDADLAACFANDLQPQHRAEFGYDYCGGLDVGVSRNAAALAIVGVRRGKVGHGRIRLACTKLWRPPKGGKINLQQIEDTIAELDAEFDLQAMNFDPFQAIHLAQRLTAAGIGKLDDHRPTRRVRMCEITQSGANLQKMATCLIESVNDRRLELYDAEAGTLRRQLRQLRVEERSYGFRLVSPVDSLGDHGDIVSALTLALLAASDLTSKPQIRSGSLFAPQPGCTQLERELAKLARAADHERYLQTLSAYDHRISAAKRISII